MNEKLELRLIESGYNPSQAGVINSQIANKVIQNIYNNSAGNPKGMILFDGRVLGRIFNNEIVVKIEDSLLAIKPANRQGGLCFYVPKANVDDLDHSFVIKNNKRSIIDDFSEGILNLKLITENNIQPKLEILLHSHEDTKILYLPRTETVEGDKLFWKHVINQYGLQLKKTLEPYSESTGPWVRCIDKKSGIEFTLGTRDNVYEVRTNFTKSKTYQKLQSIVEGLRVNPQYIDRKCWSDSSKSGKYCVVHVDIGYGDQVVEYINRVLKDK